MGPKGVLFWCPFQSPRQNENGFVLLVALFHTRHNHRAFQTLGALWTGRGSRLGAEAPGFLKHLAIGPETEADLVRTYKSEPLLGTSQGQLCFKQQYKATRSTQGKQSNSQNVESETHPYNHVV